MLELREEQTFDSHWNDCRSMSGGEAWLYLLFETQLNNIKKTKTDIMQYYKKWKTRKHENLSLMLSIRYEEQMDF